MGLLYLSALLVSIAGQVVLDRRWGLFFWRDARRAAVTLVTGVAFFLLWDAAGIGLGIFFRGVTDLMTGVLLGPELPLEEVFFLVLLCYVTMNVHGLALARWPGRGADRDGRADGRTGAGAAR
ncbi:lycopene cyclase domain-containing protein [Cellulomonas endophytica]|uniref:lycopene cyclase domain-containing protein n=1 Tax=Cellulomonas endophytica TaxID=2494735 RepID=UPI001010B3F3|nr:lycopene cyclase domain-containing protein [Cellulomonas endophytica]